MKTTIHQAIAISLSLCLASCGDDDAPGSGQKPPKSLSGPAAEQAPLAKTTRTVTANEVAKKAALDRLETMKQITAVLKPLRDPATALAEEEELNTLFTEYNRLSEVAAAEGISGRLLAGLTAHLAPGDYVDTRAEFQQYMLLVRQLGQPQREMMERLMEIGAPGTVQSKVDLDEHFKTLSSDAENASPGKRPVRPKSESEAEPTPVD
ncbi:MAG: hypothetical protein ACI8XO_002462 [Verrucomicrobiales bacterium]|jgi:hypothetical protein